MKEIPRHRKNWEGNLVIMNPPAFIFHVLIYSNPKREKEGKRLLLHDPKNKQSNCLLQ